MLQNQIYPCAEQCMNNKALGTLTFILICKPIKFPAITLV